MADRTSLEGNPALAKIKSFVEHHAAFDWTFVSFWCPQQGGTPRLYFNVDRSRLHSMGKGTAFLDASTLTYEWQHFPIQKRTEELFEDLFEAVNNYIDDYDLEPDAFEASEEDAPTTQVLAEDIPLLIENMSSKGYRTWDRIGTVTKLRSKTGSIAYNVRFHGEPFDFRSKMTFFDPEDFNEEGEEVGDNED